MSAIFACTSTVSTAPAAQNTSPVLTMWSHGAFGAMRTVPVSRAVPLFATRILPRTWHCLSRCQIKVARSYQTRHAERQQSVHAGGIISVRPPRASAADASDNRCPHCRQPCAHGILGATRRAVHTACRWFPWTAMRIHALGRFPLGLHSARSVYHGSIGLDGQRDRDWLGRIATQAHTCNPGRMTAGAPRRFLPPTGWVVWQSSQRPQFSPDRPRRTAL